MDKFEVILVSQALKFHKSCPPSLAERPERGYASYFSGRGRPALDGRLVIGLFLLKHMTVLSDKEVVMGLQETLLK